MMAEEIIGLFVLDDDSVESIYKYFTQKDNIVATAWKD